MTPQADSAQRTKATHELPTVAGVRKDSSVMNNPPEDEPPLIVVQTGRQSAPSAQGEAGQAKTPRSSSSPPKSCGSGP